MKLKTQHMFLVILLSTILHFVITTIIGNHIASRVGSLTGRVIAEGLVEVNEMNLSSKEKVDEIYQKMSFRADAAFSRWKIAGFIISLPIKPLLNPVTERIRMLWIDNQVRSGNISLNQVKHRAKMIDSVATGMNSIAFGILLYSVYILSLKLRKR